MVGPKKADVTYYEKVVPNNTTTSVLSIPISTDTFEYGKVFYLVEVVDGSSHSTSGEFVYKLRDLDGTIYSDLTSLFERNTNIGSGNLSVAWSIGQGNPALLRVYISSTLTPRAGFPKLRMIVIPCAISDNLNYL